MKILYFTATGNSLYAARCLGGELLSIPQLVRNEIYEVQDDAVGIVCPVYCGNIPKMVRRFLAKAVIKAEYLFFVCTYGMDETVVNAHVLDEAEKAGLHIDYIADIKMVDNFLPGFDMDEQMAAEPEKRIEEHLAQICEDVKAHRKWIQPVTEEDRAWHRKFLERQKPSPSGAGQTFYRVTDDCIGCGICKRICPAGCIELQGQRAVHIPGNCQMCMACIHHCPENAIRLTIPEKNPKARYHNEHIRLTEIIRANEQHEN